MSSSSLFDGLGAISRVRSLINSSRIPASGIQTGPATAPLGSTGAYNPCSTTAGINPTFTPSSSSVSHHQHHHSHHFHQAPGQSNNPFLFGRAPHSVSSLVRIALSSHFPGLD